ncbi:hypothetical protein SAMN05443572_103299 [Myxococcus fulvus]|uniref:Glycosyltransferase RgtA/B/C/D-like domain-containing protein n=1 Tax=Myxococcus fulvus TaxID=33 RepID=A0A511T8M6_MYXFU|nr:DUF6311 domain-containing protein [Myxococcus fulvus]GEN10531.1 hypothetical protein MFU01_55680 [Myxococcus fulvus]SET80425.1 hypothetical protein SAMN05443572_103299 [Myxococcus fulvus]
MSTDSRHLPWAGALLGVLWFVALGGARALDPTYLDWLGWGDWTKSILGWWFFREAPWGLPLGRTPGYMAPLTTTVGFTDSTPWVSLVLKPFSGWLPQDFQFIGLWLASCLALQGFMGVKLMALFTPRASHQLLGAALFVLAPVLVFRFGHDALCAHWMLTAMLWLHLRPRPDARSAWRTLRGALLINVLAAGVHPYLTVMVLALSTALLVSMAWQEKHLSWRQAALAFLGGCLAVGAVFVAFGYVGQDVRGGAQGFGVYSADMLALINPMGWSRVLPWLPARSGQYEGFGYLGTGVLVLALIALLGKPSVWWPQARARVRAHGPLLTAVGLLALLAFSTTMTLGGTTVVSMRKVAEPFMPVLGMFRASGRFIWPLHYVVLTGILALVAWRWRERPAVITSVLVGALLIQVVDTEELWAQQRFRSAPWPRLRAPEWAQLDSFYRHVVLYPPYIHDSEQPCTENTFARDDYVRWGDLAYRKGMSTNSGYAARFNERHVQQVCEALKADAEQGRLSAETLYVVDTPKLALFQRLGEQVTCGRVDGFNVCVAAREGRFREVLLKSSERAPLPPTAGSPITPP